MNSALDAMVEELVVSWRSMTVKTFARQMVKEVTTKVEIEPEDLDGMSQSRGVSARLRDVRSAAVPGALRPAGDGRAVRARRP
jgi:hypothetical protein